MSKPIFHTITIKVPSESIYRNPKTGSLTLIPTLTKSNAITRRLGLPCIILEKDSHIMHPEIVEKRTVGSYQKLKENYQKIKKNDTKINKNVKKFQHIDDSMHHIDREYNKLKKKNNDLYDLNDYLDLEKEFQRHLQ